MEGLGQLDQTDELGPVTGGILALGAVGQVEDVHQREAVQGRATPQVLAEGGHGGSHGRLTHEFITAIIENREPLVNIYEALAMTVPGIVAHQSALKDGETLKIPQFDPQA